MKKIYFTGQRTFGNRGCEAIVRSTIELLREKFGEIEVLVPSDDIARDSKQWPDAADKGVSFVPLYYPRLTRYWVQLQRLPLAWIKRMDWPFPATQLLRMQLENVDFVLSIGGDMYTYEGRLPAWIMGINEIAMRLGKPVVLWGATVDTFAAEPLFAPRLREHLNDMALIAVRESISESNLTTTFGLKNVIRMPDSAFCLRPEPTDIDGFWPDDSGKGVVGLNVSPLIERFRGKNNPLGSEISRFIQRIVSEKGYSVLLVPHVTPLNQSTANNDEFYLRSILESLPGLGGRVKIMNSSLNAVQTKYVICRCRFFIGARTHSTVASLSSGIPTISIAYSAKAKGINSDLLENEPVVLDLHELGADSLFDAFQYLETNENKLREALLLRMKGVRHELAIAMEALEHSVFNR